ATALGTPYRPGRSPGDTVSRSPSLELHPLPSPAPRDSPRTPGANHDPNAATPAPAQRNARPDRAYHARPAPAPAPDHHATGAPREDRPAQATHSTPRHPNQPPDHDHRPASPVLRSTPLPFRTMPT